MKIWSMTAETFWPLSTRSWRVTSASLTCHPWKSSSQSTGRSWLIHSAFVRTGMRNISIFFHLISSSQYCNLFSHHILLVVQLTIFQYFYTTFYFFKNFLVYTMIGSNFCQSYFFLLILTQVSYEPWLCWGREVQWFRPIRPIANNDW